MKIFTFSVGNVKGAGLMLGVLLALSPTLSTAEYGPITSRLTTAKFSLMKGWWGSDHNTTTPINFAYFAKLAAANGVTMDTFNLATSVAPLTQANLDKYDVMVWYNVYRMYEHFDTATGNRIQRWYEKGNKGLGCFHQCVRSSTTAQGIAWKWWIDMMGKDYNTYAGTVTGPVFIDRESFTHIYDSTKYKARQTFTWNDEWYTYTGNPRGLPGTKMMWTTADSAFTGTFNSTMGNDHPIAWTRDYDGGRFALNGMYHTSAAATATGALKVFMDESFISLLRYMAGYTGCMDPKYTEYNPKATHQETNSCGAPTSNSSYWISESEPGKVRADAFKIAFSQPGPHSVEIFDTRGGKVANYHGNGTGEFSPANALKPGIYFMKILTAGMKSPMSRRIALL